MDLRQQLSDANVEALRVNSDACAQLTTILQAERKQSAVDRANLLSQISNLVHAQGKVQDTRISQEILRVQNTIDESRISLHLSHQDYNTGMELWDASHIDLVENIMSSRDKLKSKLKDDWTVSYKNTGRILN
jgi:kinesin family protein 11